MYSGEVDQDPRCPVCREPITGIAGVGPEEVRGQERDRAAARFYIRKDADPYSLFLMASRRDFAPGPLGADAVGRLPAQGIERGNPQSAARAAAAPGVAEAIAEAQQRAERRRKGESKGRSGPQSQHLLAEDLQPRRQNGFDSFYPWWPAEDDTDHAADVFLTDKVGPSEEAILPDTWGT